LGAAGFCSAGFGAIGSGVAGVGAAGCSGLVPGSGLGERAWGLSVMN